MFWWCSCGETERKKGVRKRKGADAEAVKEQTNEQASEREQNNMIWTMAKVDCISSYVCVCVVCVCVYTSLFAIDDESYGTSLYSRCMHGWRAESTCYTSTRFCAPDHIDKNEAYLGRGQWFDFTVFDVNLFRNQQRLLFGHYRFQIYQFKYIPLVNC